MAKEKSTGRKVFCGCLTAIAVVLLIVIIIGAYALLYVPKDETLTAKLDKKDNLTAIRYNSESEVSISAALMLTVLQKVTDLEIKDLTVVEFFEEGYLTDDSKAYGIVVYTDSIKTSTEAMVNYIKFIMDKENEDVKDLSSHVSIRGNALFFGNSNAEIEFRKVVF